MCLSPQATFRLGWGLRRSLKSEAWHGLEDVGTESRPPNLHFVARGLWSGCNLYSWQVEWRVEDSAGPDACAVWWDLLCLWTTSKCLHNGSFSLQEMPQVRFAPCPGCLALSQDQRYAAYLARVQPHCGYQYQALWCASGVWTRPWLPLVSSSRHWLSNGFPMLILIQLLSNGLRMVSQWFPHVSTGYPMVYQWFSNLAMVIQWLVNGFTSISMGSWVPIGCIICFLPGSPLRVGTTSPSWRQSLGSKGSPH